MSTRSPVNIIKNQPEVRLLREGKENSKETRYKFPRKSVSEESPFLAGLTSRTIVRILTFVDPLSVCMVSATNMRLNNIANEDAVWAFRLKPADKSEQNGSKENTNTPARVQFIRANSRWCAWAYQNLASKFMRNFHSASSITNILALVNRPLESQEPQRRLLEQILERELIAMLREDDEWRPPVMACVVSIILGLSHRALAYPVLTQTFWQLLLDTQVSDKVMPKIVVAAYFCDPNFKKSALEFVEKAIDIITECKKDVAASSTTNNALESKSMSMPQVNELASDPSRSVTLHRRSSTHYVDSFCLTCAVLTVVEVAKLTKKQATWVKTHIPKDILALLDNHAYNRSAKAGKEWLQIIKENSKKLGLASSKCAIM